MTLPRFTSGSAGRLGFPEVNSFFERIEQLKKNTPKDRKPGPPSGRIVTAKVASSVGQTHSWYEVMKAGNSFVPKINGMSSTSNGDAFAHPIVGQVDQVAEMVVIVAQYEADGRLFYIPLANGPCACSGGGSCYFYQQRAPTEATVSYFIKYEFRKFWGPEVFESNVRSVRVENADMALVAIEPERYAWVTTGNSGTTEVLSDRFDKAAPGTFSQAFQICNPTSSPPPGCIPICSFCRSSSSVQTTAAPVPIGPYEFSITCFDPCRPPFENPQLTEDWNVLVHDVTQYVIENYNAQSANCCPNEPPFSESFEFGTYFEQMVKLVGKRGCLANDTFSEVTAYDLGVLHLPNCEPDAPCIDNGWCAGIGRCLPEPTDPLNSQYFSPNRLPRLKRICAPDGVLDLHECRAYCNGQTVAVWSCTDVRPIYQEEEITGSVQVIVR